MGSRRRFKTQQMAEAGIVPAQGHYLVCLRDRLLHLLSRWERDIFGLLSFLFPLYVILLLATRQQQSHSSLECERFSNKRSSGRKKPHTNKQTNTWKRGGICCFSVTTGQLKPATCRPPVIANNSVYSEPDRSGAFGPQTGLTSCKRVQKQYLSLPWFCSFPPHLCW